MGVLSGEGNSLPRPWSFSGEENIALKAVGKSSLCGSPVVRHSARNVFSLLLCNQIVPIKFNGEDLIMDPLWGEI